MSSEMGQSEKMLVEIAATGGGQFLKRLALVVQDSRMSYAAAALREQVQTFSVETLAELRAALSQHVKQQLEAEERGEKDAANLVAAIDITRLPLDDTKLFASNLRPTSQFGLVYILTPEQIELFEEGTFDFVVR